MWSHLIGFNIWYNSNRNSVYIPFRLTCLGPNHHHITALLLFPCRWMERRSPLPQPTWQRWTGSTMSWSTQRASVRECVFLSSSKWLRMRLKTRNFQSMRRTTRQWCTFPRESWWWVRDGKIFVCTLQWDIVQWWRIFVGQPWAAFPKSIIIINWS